MLEDFRSLPGGETFSADICICGAGAAGIPMALELARRGISVILLESGGIGLEEDIQALYEGELAGLENTDLSYSRLRQFGGTTGHWTGQCAPLDPLDFKQRTAVPHSGWPINRKILDPFYERAQPYLQLGPYRYSTESWGNELSGTPLPLDPETVTSAVYQYSPPTRFAETYQGDVEGEENLRCLLHANVIHMKLASGTDRLESLTISTLDGKKATVSARKFVLACGGIENARLLLNFNTDRPAGLGNENDLVGRYYMDHLNIVASSIVLADNQTDLGFYSQATTEAQLGMALRLTDPVIEREGLLNNAAFLQVVWENPDHNDDFRDHAWLSFSSMAKAFARGQVPDRLAENACNVIEQPGPVVTGIYRNIARRFTGGGVIKAIDLKQDAEQSPNPDSRVMLGEDIDPLGMRRVILDWQVAPGDMDSLRRTHMILGAELGKAGLGRLNLGISDPADVTQAFTGYHHIGTTRMHANPRQGVVDADCRVHSVDNLYVAGSSVFTTCGAANPTLTIVALALRLGDHLADTLQAA
ncbi:GMC oxidoreductase [Cucumibacter marinus]|uniref:GMC oxidoreductase n=1 Tax=Cucumibacter marinus TaxID=1121252 RepID=UPI00040AB13A|nr:GMC family oxidoreductase [Cucumibacter marinus]